LNSEQLKTNKGKLLEGPLVIKPIELKDERGSFIESWNQRNFDNLIKEVTFFVQDNHSISSKGVLRGLHYQLPPSQQGKLVRCTRGQIFDLALDIRMNSKTYGEWSSVELSSLNKKQFWIPAGFAHGFLTLTNSTEVQYKVTNYWNKNDERTIRWDDPILEINWPKDHIISEKLVVSQKDSSASTLKDLEIAGDIFE
tara:strand:+ start:1475 stop:2065 length:591 start_codon:yes stop_codon:yes gene_type:complete